MSKNAILKGTIILTIAGFSTRLLGFFYRIYLSNSMGTANLGVYQLIFPVYGLCFTLYASGIETAISTLVASSGGTNIDGSSINKTIARKRALIILKTGILCSLVVATTLSILLIRNAEFIATRLILEPSCASSLRILAYAFPFCGITACINGYYFGLKKATIPASTQLLEQIIRVSFVFVFATYFGKGDGRVTCELAALGLVIGEIGSNIYNILSLFLEKKEKKTTISHQSISNKIRTDTTGPHNTFKNMIKLSVPLTMNRFLVSILHSFEAILIPAMLRLSGLTDERALSVYGILTGMAIPFILFPSTITNSLSMLLLPTVSEAQSKNNEALINKTTTFSIKYSIIIGLFSTALFIIFGNALGNLIFHNQEAGEFLIILAWLCPFLYLTTTLSSIINGLGKAHITFINTIVGLVVRILFVIFLIPKHGIGGYLIGLLVSQLVISAMDLFAILKHVKVRWNAIDWIAKPGVILLFIGYLFMRIYQYLSTATNINNLLLLFLVCLILTVCFVVLLFISKTVSMKEFKS